MLMTIITERVTMVELTLEHVSKHLTEDVIERAFKLKTNSDDQVKSIEVTRGAPAGEGLISAVYRITVSGSEHKAKFIAKGLVSDVLLRNTLGCASFFKREIKFFSKILPVLSEVQKTSGAKENIQDNIPLYYGCHIDGNDDYILLEDMSETNCVSISSPTKRERDMTLKTLAHFHALSLALRLKKPDEFTNIAKGLDEFYYSESNRDWYSKYLQQAIEICKKVVVEYEDPKGIYYKKFYDLASTDVYGQLMDLSTTWGQHPVFNHGDAWFPNFLFGKDKSVAIDFQLCRCASPAIDLSYFIILCCHLCRTKDDYDESVGVYYNALKHYLDDMSIDIKKVFSYEMLQGELKKYGKFGFLAALTSIPLLASQRCDVMQSFELKDPNLTRIPLEELWKLSPIEAEDQKLNLINAVHIAVDAGLI